MCMCFRTHGEELSQEEFERKRSERKTELLQKFKLYGEVSGSDHVRTT